MIYVENKHNQSFRAIDITLGMAESKADNARQALTKLFSNEHKVYVIHSIVNKDYSREEARGVT